jgi:hypothetical protein
MYPPMDNLASLRLHNLFMPQGVGDPPPESNPNGNPLPPPQPAPNPTPQDSGTLTDQPYDVQQRMKQLYTPSTSAQTAYSDAAKNIPSVNTPSRMRRIGAMIAGLNAPNGGAAYDTASRIVNDPNTQAMNRYRQQVSALQPAAAQEQSQNKIDQQEAFKVIADEQVAKKEADLKANNILKDKQAEEKIQIAANRAAAYTFHQNNPIWKASITPDGELVYTNPQDPTAKPVYTSVNTYHDVGDLEKLNLGLQAAQARVNTQQAGANQRNQVTIAGAAARTDAQQIGANTRAAGAQSGATDRTNIREQGATDRRNTPPPTKTVTTTISPDKQSKTVTTGTARTTDVDLSKGKNTTPAPVDTGTVQMKHPVTGKVGPVKKENVEAAKKAGYTIVSDGQ